jgi:galactokinase
MANGLPSSAELTARLDEWAPQDGAGAAPRVVRAPGRVNLIGEHTDYNDGLVLPAAIDREIRIGLRQTTDRRVRLRRLDDGTDVTFDLDALPPPTGSWADYPIGVAWALLDAGLDVRGFDGVLASNLAVGAGLSSSAALELASAWALLGDAAAAIDPLDLARSCQRAENAFVGVNCGLMDQFASACGRAGSALLLDCRSLAWRPVPVPPGLALVICDSGSPRGLHTSEYNLRRAECEAALAVLARRDPSIRALRDVPPDRLEDALRQLDPVLARRVRHVVTENARVEATILAFEAGDVAEIGRLFAASHASLRDDFEVSSPELDLLVTIATATPGVIAARMTGAGFGGSTVNLVEPGAVDRLARAVAGGYVARTGLTASVEAVNAADGAGLAE